MKFQGQPSHAPLIFIEATSNIRSRTSAGPSSGAYGYFAGVDYLQGYHNGFKPADFLQGQVGDFTIGFSYYYVCNISPSAFNSFEFQICIADCVKMSDVVWLKY